MNGQGDSDTIGGVGLLPRLWVYTNYDCNLSCTYCVTRSSPRAERRAFPDEAFPRLVDEAAAIGIEQLFITGGEPFLLSNIWEKLLYASSRLPTRVLTNGTLFYGQRLERLRALQGRNISFQVTIDGAAAEHHDGYRGSGSWERAVKGVRTLRDLGFTVYIGSTETPLNSSHLDDLRQFVSSLGIPAERHHIRKLARRGHSEEGIVLSEETLVPEMTVTRDGVFWHPFGTEDDLLLTRSIFPLRDAVSLLLDRYGRLLAAGATPDRFKCGVDEPPAEQPEPRIEPVSLATRRRPAHGVRQGVVLAAGRGSRLQPLSDYIPKPLQPVCNKPIMQYQFEAMRDAGITDIAVVIGPTSGAIRDYFGDGRDVGVHLEYIEDPAPAGIAASLELAQPWVEGPFAVFLGDIFLALNGLEPALAPLAEGAAGSIVVHPDTRERVQQNFAVLTDARGAVHRVIEKPANPPTALKGCGVYVFDRAIFEAIAKTPVSPLRNEREITDAVQILVDMGRPVYATDIVRWDMNITYPEDLLLCNLRMLREQRLESLVAEGAYVSDRVTLSASIIGPRAVVDVPASLNQCLVLPGVHVGGIGGSVQRGIFAEGMVWMTGIPA